MKAISQHVRGDLLQEGGQAVLRLQDPAPVQRGPDSLMVRFALVTAGREEHIFPALLLDDWGREVRGMRLYDWVAEFGEQFPRAEVFGFERGGQETQLFLRVVELYARYPCYVFAPPGARRDGVPDEGVLLDAVLLDAVLLDAVLLEGAEATRPQPTAPPATLAGPWPRARLSWWRLPAGVETFDFSLLTPSAPGI